MTRVVFPFQAPDISALARVLGRELEACADKPGHVQLLNMLTRSAGFRNFQHFRAEAEARERLEQPVPPPDAPEPVDYRRVERAARLFDEAGVLSRWPSKESLRLLCLWGLWAALPAGLACTEREINERLATLHGFGDYALLRRLLCDLEMMTRTRDGRVYRRVERRPPAEALALIRHLDLRRARSGGRGAQKSETTG